MRYFKICVFVALIFAACGGEEESGENKCEPNPECGPTETVSAVACADCQAVSDGCGGTSYCKPDDEEECLTSSCQEGEYKIFGECPQGQECETRTSCGEEILCGDRSACLAEARCLDGGLPIDECPENSSGCLPQEFCGVQKKCLTIDPCAQDACDPGEAPTILTCEEADTEFPCREITACGGNVDLSCICAAQELECDPEETFDTEPCVPGQECREVRGCGQVFYCKGDSI